MIRIVQLAAMLAAVAVAVGLVACGGGPAADTGAPPPPEEDPTIVTHDFEDGTLEGDGFVATESNTPLNKQREAEKAAEAGDDQEAGGDDEGQGEGQ